MWEIQSDDSKSLWNSKGKENFFFSILKTADSKWNS